jgi:two-component system chemotaxis response regulator CheB
MDQIRVIVADDSMVARAVIRGFLESDPAITVMAEATNGQEAVDLVQRYRPDLVTMDLEMPVMGGMEAIEEIMATAAVPILVVSGVADAQRAYDAVSRGALEVIPKPQAEARSQRELVAKVKLLSKIKVITHIRPYRSPGATASAGGAAASWLGLAKPAPSVASPLLRASPGRVFAIASSTGGPQALSAILPQLPACFPCPIVIAQHISEGFAGGLVDWLATLCRLRVQLAVDGERLEAGVVYVAPPETHQTVTRDRRLVMVSRGVNDLYHPSCDVLLASVAEAFGPDAVGIILTGMGSDGVRGMDRILRGGGVTLAQNEATSLIYGMNRAAVERGTVLQVLPLERLPSEMMTLAGLAASTGVGAMA